MADNQGLISIAPQDDVPQQPKPQQISIAPEESLGTVTLPLDTVMNRSARALIGVPQLNMEHKDIYAQINDGHEDELRRQAASAIDRQRSIQQIDAINQIAGKQGPLSLPEEAMFRDMLRKRQQDPKTVFEEGYAQKFMDGLYKAAQENPNTPMADALRYIPNEVKQDIDTGKDLKAKQEYFRTLFENAQAAYQKQSWVGWGADQFKELLTAGMYSQIKLRGLTGDTSVFHGGLGMNMDRQAADLYFMPFDKAVIKAKAIYDQLIKDNPGAAMSFFSAVVGQSYNERTAQDLMPLGYVDLLGGAALGVASSRGLAGLRYWSRRAVRDFVRTAEPEVSQVAIDEAAGNIRSAATTRAAQNLVDQVIGNTVDPERSMTSPLPSILRPRFEETAGILRDSRGLSQEGVNRIMERATSMWDQFTDTVSRAQQVEQLPALLAAQQVGRRILDDSARYFRGIDNTLIDAVPRKGADNVWYIDSHFGRTGIELFERPEQAAEFMAAHPVLADGEIQPAAAGGFYIAKTRPMDQVKDWVRESLIANESVKTPRSILNSLIGAYRTPEETQSYAQLLNRKIATFGPSNFFKLISDNSKEIEKLRSWSTLLPGKARQKWKEFERVMKANEYVDPETNRLEAVFKTPGEVGDAYQFILGRLPDEQEVRAAFDYKRNLQMLHEFQKWDAYKQLARLGMEEHTFTLKDVTKDFSRETARSIPLIIQERNFTVNARRLDTVPTASAVMLVVDEKGKTSVVNASTWSGKYAAKIKQDVLEGKKIALQVSKQDVLEKPFYAHPGVGDEPVEYVITSSSRASPIDWNKLKVARLATTDYEHYVTQPILHYSEKLKQWRYLGDRTIAAFNIGSMSRDVAGKLDKIRSLMAAGDEEAARAFYNSNPLPQSWREISGWFRPDVTTEGLPIPSNLSTHAPIRSVPRGRTQWDLDKAIQEKYTGVQNEVGQYRGFNPEFTDPYDMFTYRNSGTKANPLYDIVPTNRFDPITTFNRAMTRAINSLYMNDFKVQAVEHWLQEAKDLSRISSKDLASNPYYHFFNGDKDDFWKLNPEQSDRVSQLKMANKQIQQFMGVQDKSSNMIHWMTQKLADSIYEKSPKLAQLLPISQLASTNDPFRFMRSMVFHAKLGLFSIPQLWVQLQTFSTIMGIAGIKNAGVGARSTLLHIWSRVNGSEEILNTLDKYSGMMPGHWREARDLFTRGTGFENVAGEHAFRDSTNYYDFIGNKIDQILHAGSFFFREGERNVRAAAWYTAYKEFRDLNPTVALQAEHVRDILQRADLLSVNMSRASSSQINRGIFSIPTQFLAYQMRTAELFMGKRLTQAERFRLFGTYGALYGVPIAFGLSGVPVGDFINKWAQEGGYVTGGNYANTAITEGLPSLIMGLISGNYYNVGERYGVQGFEQIRNAMRSDRGIWDILVGASGSTLMNAFGAGVGTIENGNFYTSGLTKAIVEAIKGEGDYKFKVEDVVDMFKEISSVNSTWRLYMALNTGKWMTKTGGPISDVSKSNAIFMYLSGLSPQESAASVNKEWIRHTEKELQQYAEKKFAEEYRRSIFAQDDNNPQQARDYLNRAINWLRITDYPMEEYGQAFSKASAGIENQIDRVAREFGMKQVPNARKPIAEGQLRGYLEAQGK